MTQFLPETAAMLRNLIDHAKESGKTHAEVVAWIVSEVLKDLPTNTPTNAGQPKAETTPTAPVRVANSKGDQNPTGPVVEWKPPVGGWYRHDGRFVKDETWKPVEQTVEQERAPSVPDVLAQTPRNPNVGSHVAPGKDGRMNNLCATGPLPVEWVDPNPAPTAAQQIVYVPPAKKGQ